MVEKRTRKTLDAVFIFITLICVAISWAGLGASLASGAEKNSKKTSPEQKPLNSPSSSTKVMVSGKPLHLSCSRSLRDLKNNRLECFGNVYIRRPSELLTADYAILDMKSDQLHAEGNVVYLTPDTVIYGVKMDFNFVTETGVIDDGRVESDKYQLLGEKIERLSSEHFIAYDGEYTTCRDCPASWKLVGKKIDFEVDSYARLKHVFVKINEAPSMYLPYAVIPVKTKRQSGLLFPKFQPTSPNGLTFVQPFFWATSRSMDATFGAGIYALRGFKGEAEYRYALGARSSGELNAFYLRDRQFIRAPYFHRWAGTYRHNWELPLGIDHKFFFIDTSDRDYIRKIGDLSVGQGEPALVSQAGVSKTSRSASVWVTGKRIKSNLTPGFTGFDNTVVQSLPSFSVSTTDHRLIDSVPLSFGLNFNYTRFTRDASAFDELYEKDFRAPVRGFFQPGFSPIRKAQRFTLIPEVYYPLRLAEVFEFEPSVQYRGYYYLFDDQIAPSMARGFLLAQAEFATTVEKVYSGSVKHKIRPSLTYSNIPSFQQDGNHPFIKQLNTPGFQFDEEDIVPISNPTQLYFVPYGNSLRYRLNNKFILKDDGVYRKVVELMAGQSINFIEFRKGKGEAKQPFSRLEALLNINTLHLNGNGTFYYYPATGGSTYNLSLTYILGRYMRRVLSFDRSVTLDYISNQVLADTRQIGGSVNWSFNESFSMMAGLNYQFPSAYENVIRPGVILGVKGGLAYQSPSQCYKLVLSGSWNYENQKVAINWSIPINLTGDGFSNFQDGGALPGGGR